MTFVMLVFFFGFRFGNGTSGILSIYVQLFNRFFFVKKKLFVFGKLCNKIQVPKSNKKQNCAENRVTLKNTIHMHTAKSNISANVSEQKLRTDNFCRPLIMKSVSCSLVDKSH